MSKTDIQLKSNDCGISAIKTIYNILQKPISRLYIEQHIQIEEKGSRISDLRDFFFNHGFEVSYKLLDINYVQNNLKYLKDLFPFIISIKHRERLHYVVVNGIKGKKLKIHDPGKGSEYFLSLHELKNKAHFSKSNWQLLETEEKLKLLCSGDLAIYNINLENALFQNQNNITELFNKLTYFTYLKENFGFKNKNVEKSFLLDLLKNQEISKVPRHFRSLKYKNNKISITAPLALVVKMKDKAIGMEIPESKEKNIYWKLFKQLEDQKRLWYIYIFAAFFSASVTQLAVFTNQILIDHVLPSFNLGTLILFAIGLGIYKLFDIFTSAYKRFVGVHLGNILDKFFLNEFDNKINNSSLPYIQSYKKGDLIERVSDALKLKRFFLRFFTNILIDIFVSVYSLLILFYINWKLTLLVTGVMILFYLWFRFITPYLKQNERLRYIRKADFLSKMIEKIEGIQVIKSFGIEQIQSNKISNSTSKYLKIQLKNGYINLVNNIVIALIIIVSSIFIILTLTKSAIQNQEITLGQIVTFIALSGKIFTSLRNILSENLTLQENEVILKRFLDFEEVNRKDTENTKGIRDFSINSFFVNNLSFGYHADNLILKRINLKFTKGEKLKIEGQNGSGKSTLSKIFTALYKPNSGEILINENNSRFYNSQSIKSKILLSTNEDILFNDTLAGNICLGQDLSTSEIIKLSKLIGFYDFISSKEEGLDFIINENGKNLSTGQRKKIILLRAFFSKAEIIILDEVLSGIDLDSRKMIERFINNDSRTFIIISHEPIHEIQFSKKYEIRDGELNIV